VRIVSIDELTEDMKLARHIIDRDTGRILLGVGVSDLVQYADRLRGNGITYIYVEDSVSAGIDIPQSVSEDLLQSAEQALDRVYETCAMLHRPDLLVTKQLVQELILEIVANPEILINVYEMRCNGGDFLGHSINVAFLSLMLGKQLGYGNDSLKQLGMGALLHDVGVTGMPKSLLTKRGELTVEEKLLYEQHSVLGYNRVKTSWEIAPASRAVILSHHERSDGSGYPNRLLKGDISDFSRIVGLADCFEELTGGHPFSRGMGVKDGLELLVVKAGDWFDTDLVKDFVSWVPLFQVGTTVRLSNGSMGVVVAQNKGYPARPVLRVFQDESGKRIDPGFEVDLLKNNHLVLQ
jgi:HD-GYP domain-containing protein (c-di-GMP phosphodiesterase class II)